MRRALLAVSLLLGALLAQGCSTPENGQAVAVSTGPFSASAALSSVGEPSTSGPGSSTPTVASTVTVTTTPAMARPSTTSSSPVTTAAVSPKPNAAPACWTAQSCPALARVVLPDGWSVVVINPSDNSSVMILSSGGQVFDQLAMNGLGGHPVLTCLTISGAPEMK